jgi:hypothetical protein
MVESTQKDVLPRAKGNPATLKNKQLKSRTFAGEEVSIKTLKNKQLKSMILAGEEVGTKISKNKRFKPIALTGEEIGTKTLRQEGERIKTVLYKALVTHCV